MKTLLTVLTIITSSSVSAFTDNYSVKDWTWGSEMNDQGVFLASTRSLEKGTGLFTFGATPEGGKCDLTYYISHFMQTKSSEPKQTFKDIQVFFRVDKKQGWGDKVNVDVEGHDDYKTITYMVSVAKDNKFTLELLAGTRLYAASNYSYKESPTTENTFSLMGSRIAMNAVYNRCQDHLESFPNYSASKDSRTAIKLKQKSKAQQKVTDKASSI